MREEEEEEEEQENKKSAKLDLYRNDTTIKEHVFLVSPPGKRYFWILRINVGVRDVAQ